MSASGTGPARLLRVYGLWIVLVTAVVVGAAVAVGLAMPVVYRAEATVVVEAKVRQNTTPVAPDMGTEKELARSGLIVGPAARDQWITPAELLDGLTVGVTPDANVLTVDYTAADAATAARRASAVARAYVAYRNGNGGGAANALSQRATLVTDAVPPAKSEDSRLPITIGVGAALGLLLGVGSALIRDRFDDRLRGRADLERVAGVPVLATVPRLRGRFRRFDPRPVILRAPGGRPAEAFRYLRSRVQPAPGRTETILVTSATAREGRTTTATNLAAALALSGREVVLVDTDLRRPGIDEAFGIVNGIGVTSVLAGEVPVTEVLRGTPVPRLRLLTAGLPHEHAVDQLEGLALTRLLEQVRGCCDVVVLDSAPILSVADAVALAAVSDHVIVVADHRRTTRTQIAGALRELGERDGRRVSTVLLNAPSEAEPMTPARPRRASADGTARATARVTGRAAVGSAPVPSEPPVHGPDPAPDPAPARHRLRPSPRRPGTPPSSRAGRTTRWPATASPPHRWTRTGSCAAARHTPTPSGATPSATPEPCGAPSTWWVGRGSAFSLRPGGGGRPGPRRGWGCPASP